MTTVRVLERPVIDRGTGEDFEEEYCFYTGETPLNYRIIGWTSADCWVCAWKYGYHRWPELRGRTKLGLALMSEPSDRVRPCSRHPRGEMYLFYKEQTIYAGIYADCKNCAWGRAYPHFAHLNIAINIPCQISDAGRACAGRKTGSEDAGP